jgi:3-hydroxyisobutyrate dehydrogenase-like beta-hydroxyacid dehydrogenase
MLKVGWIGVGKMGKPMSKRLLDAGYEVYVCDIVKSNTDEVVKAGAVFVDTPAELTRKVDVVFSIIPNGKVLKDIVLGENGIENTVCPGKIIVDMSTVDPESSGIVNDAIEKKGGKFIRANVTGSVEYAEKGTLGGLCSGDREAYEKVLPLIKILTIRQYYLGPKDEARYMKIIINMLLGSSMQAMGEALTMGEAVGLEWNTMVEAIADSAAACPAIKFKTEQFKKRDFRPMSTAAIMDKDMDLALDIARKYKLAMPVASIARQFYCSMGSTGKADLDYSAVLLVNEELNGIKRGNSQ